MNKIFLILLFSLGLFSSASCQIIEPYIKNEIAKVKKLQVITILTSYRKNTKHLLEIYCDSIQKKVDKAIKEFDETRFRDLSINSRKDSIAQYWSENDINTFGFDDISLSGNNKNSMELDLKYKSKRVIFYTLTKPVIINNGKKAIFYINRNAPWLGGNIESSIVVMKKEKGNWVFVEKIKGRLFTNQ